MTGPEAREPSAPVPDDRRVVRAQIGREPRGSWTVATRCAFGRPTAIAVEPGLGGAERFPTTFWLTCPWLVAAVSDAESSGGCAAWTCRIAGDAELARAVLAADARYRSERAVLAGGVDPCEDVGTAGQSDPLAVKCLHARVAASLAGIPDPVGAAVLGQLVADGGGIECDGDPCAAAPDVGVGAAG